MTMTLKLRALAATALVGLAACSDFLEPEEAVVDPNRPTNATARQVFVGTQTNLWAYLASDPVRTANIWSQNLTGVQGQYLLVQQYSNSEVITNGFNQGLYVGGGLVDIRRGQDVALETGDDLFLGIFQVQEAILMSIGADLFGDVVYSQALSETENPPLDEQLAVYDALLALLDEAIANMASTDPTNVGPGSSDLSYGGDAELWTKLAHSIKARIHFRLAEVRPESYASALAEARLGLSDPSEDYVAVFSGAANEQNFWYQFFEVERADYIRPNPTFVALLQGRGDPRLSYYFNAAASNLSATLLGPSYAQPLIPATENLLNWAEAAYRTGATAEALTQLNAARAAWSARGVTLAPVAAAGPQLLREILTERYVSLFQTYEPFMQYKRTCFPNLQPTVAGGDIPSRMFYDTSERQTNTNIPPGDQQPVRNDNDPANGTDPFGGACVAEPPGA